MAGFNPDNCASYRPGHNVHCIQARVESHHPRHDVNVQLLSPFALRVSTAVQDEILFHHSATELYLWTVVAVEGKVEYAPESQLIYVNCQVPGTSDGTAWLIGYLAKEELEDCHPIDPNKSFKASDVFESDQ